jgi:hypothetical protein
MRLLQAAGFLAGYLGDELEVLIHVQDREPSGWRGQGQPATADAGALADR